MKKIQFLATTVSFKDLVTIWVESLHEDEYVVVVYDPTNHTDLLKSINLGHDSLKKLYESKVLILTFDLIEDAQSMFKKLKKTNGPYCQMYFLGKYITDNIDE